MVSRTGIALLARTPSRWPAFLGRGLCVALAAASLWSAGARAAPTQSAALEPIPRVVEPEAAVPSILSREDIARYRRIFALQEAGRWRQADRIIRQLDDRLLMGHVLFQRYMHPTKYRSSYKELHYWLKDYADHPGAQRLYRLAQRRHLKGWKQPPRPVAGYLSGSGDTDLSVGGRQPEAKARRSRSQAARVSKLEARIARYVRRGHPELAEKVLRRKDVRRLFNKVEFDRARARVAAGYFFAGKDEKALELAKASAERSRRFVEMADWTAGLAAWRLGEMATAERHFSALARSTTASRWTVAAGAYWAARVQLVTWQPESVTEMLDIAASYPRTFYGLLAARLLARDIDFSWEAPPLADEDVAKLLELAPTRRAIALYEVGRDDLAEREIRKLYPRVDGALGRALLGLAARLQLAGAAMRLGVEQRDRNGRLYDSALYPVPRWRPPGGFAIDRALVYAFMRQESGFNVRAKSRVGARGLMQLMPRTASYLANDSSLRRRNRAKLFDPEFNIKLGQEYLKRLMADEAVNKNLFLLAAAYNGGPGNVKKWLRKVRHQQDPLMFIESIPSLETRIFIERVLTNYWIYRMRLSQDTPSLDAIAAGNWPYYLAQDQRTFTVARNVQD